MARRARLIREVICWHNAFAEGNPSKIGGEDGMAGELKRDTLFVALTRPQMFAGVTYSFFIINGVIAVELFIIFRSLWVLLAAVVIHLAGMVASLREPRFVDLWLTRVRNCPRVKNHALWRCNSYRP
jgi:type IV secretion system protein VirB3